MVERSNQASLAGEVMNPATALARSTVRQLIELGIQDVVLSPGSRNAPLSLAFHYAESKGLINLQVRIDERGAALQKYDATAGNGRRPGKSGAALDSYEPARVDERGAVQEAATLHRQHATTADSGAVCRTAAQDGLRSGEDAGAAVDTASARGWTALMMAAQKAEMLAVMKAVMMVEMRVGM